MLPFSLSVMQSLRLGFAIALIAVFQSSALTAQVDRAHLSSDPRVNTARMLVEAGRYGEALSNLRPLVPDHADRIDALFLVGPAALGAAQIPDAGDSCTATG